MKRGFLFSLICLALFIPTMAVIGMLLRPVTDAHSDWMIRTFGIWPAFFITFGVIGALWIWGYRRATRTLADPNFVQEDLWGQPTARLQPLASGKSVGYGLLLIAGFMIALMIGTLGYLWLAHVLGS